MSSIGRIFKKIIFWSYGRSTLQYDALCIAILAFVFLTPKSWFDQGELPGNKAHLNGLAAAERLLIRSENLGPNPGARELERGAQSVTGRSEVHVKGWRELRDASGRVAAYEVDIE